MTLPVVLTWFAAAVSVGAAVIALRAVRRGRAAATDARLQADRMKDIADQINASDATEVIPKVRILEVAEDNRDPPILSTPWQNSVARRPARRDQQQWSGRNQWRET